MKEAAPATPAPEANPAEPAPEAEPAARCRSEARR